MEIFHNQADGCSKMVKNFTLKNKNVDIGVSEMSEEIFVSDFVKTVKSGFKLPKRVKIFDTTLRDGEQTPGISVTPQEKLQIARQLDKIGVDVIEAGFPITSEGERKAIRKIVSEKLKSEICGLARTLQKDIDVAIDCGVDSVHTFIGTSDWHLKYKLNMSQEEALGAAVKSVEYVKSRGLICEFSCEDATRTSLDYLIKVYKAVEEAGVDRINVPDTVGVMIPKAMFELISRLKQEIKVPISVHCHNDFGLAVANSLAGVEAGAEQVHVTVNGLGERAGNASLEQVVMGLIALYGACTNINTKGLTETSDLVEKATNVYLPPNYPIIGRNAFSHEAGIHVHGILQSSACYEPLTPEMVGQRSRIVLGKHTGTHAVEASLNELGFKVTKDQLSKIVEKIKELGDKKKRIVEKDLMTIAHSIISPKKKGAIKLKEIVVTTGNRTRPKAHVKLMVDGKELKGEATGVGPVDAAANAIQKLVKMRLKLRQYKLEAITGGTNALAAIEIEMEDKSRNIFNARAVDKDVVMASVKALIDCINKVKVIE